MKFLTLFLSLIFLQQSIAAQNEKITLDSLNKLSKTFVCINSVKSDSISDIVIKRAKLTNEYSAEGYALKNKGTNQFCLSNFEEAVALFKSSISVFDQAKNIEGKTRSLNNLTASYKSLHYLDSALISGKNQILAAKILGDTFILSTSYQTLSSIYFEQIRNDSAMFYNNIALKLAEEANLIQLQGSCYLDVANINFRIMEYDEAIKYYKQAIPLLEQSSDIRNLISARTNLTGSYSETGNYEEAIKICKENIEIFANYPYYLSSSYHALAHNYFKIKDYEKSISNNLLGLKHARESGNVLMVGTTLSNLASGYVKTKQYDKALKNGAEAIEFSTENDLKENLVFSYEHTAEAFKGIGNYKKAHELLEKAIDLNSEIRGKEQAEMVSELRIEYEVEKKDLQAQNAIQQKELTEVRLKKNKTLFSSILLAGILGLIALLAYFNSFKNKKKAEIALSDLNHAKSELKLERQYRTAELKALKAQMNPHFLFNSFNSLQSYIIENEKKLAIGYLGKFADLMRTYLNHSKESSISLNEEIKANELYLALEKVRFNDTLNYTIKVDPSLEEETIQIPPMLLQPFIENALKHGLKHKANDKQLLLGFQKEGTQLVCTIKDNGIGRAASNAINARNQPSHQSFATGATNERIELINDTRKQKIKLKIEDLVDDQNKVNGTNVTLSIPL